MVTEVESSGSSFFSKMCSSLKMYVESVQGSRVRTLTFLGKLAFNAENCKKVVVCSLNLHFNPPQCLKASQRLRRGVWMHLQLLPKVGGVFYELEFVPESSQYYLQLVLSITLQNDFKLTNQLIPN